MLILVNGVSECAGVRWPIFASVIVLCVVQDLYIQLSQCRRVICGQRAIYYCDLIMIIISL